MNHFVYITDDKGHVDNDTVTVKAGDQVTWTARPGQQSTVVFDSSPFGATTFTVPAGGSISSGTSTAPNGNYKYTVHGKSGLNDPIVIIDGCDTGG